MLHKPTVVLFVISHLGVFSMRFDITNYPRLNMSMKYHGSTRLMSLVSMNLYPQEFTKKQRRFFICPQWQKEVSGLRQCVGRHSVQCRAVCLCFGWVLFGEPCGVGWIKILDLSSMKSTQVDPVKTLWSNIVHKFGPLVRSNQQAFDFQSFVDGKATDLRVRNALIKIPRSLCNVVHSCHWLRQRFAWPYWHGHMEVSRASWALNHRNHPKLQVDFP